MQVEIRGSELQLVRGDITEEQVDAIVNAANARLAGGAGVDGAIHRRGGPDIMDETRRRHPSGCPTGSAVASAAGDLSARFVFHAVGPVWRGGQAGESDLLAGAYHRCLELAVEHDCRSMAFPAISCGAYGYPIAEAANVALSTVAQWLERHELPELVRFVLFGDDTYELFRDALRQLVV